MGGGRTADVCQDVAQGASGQQRVEAQPEVAVRQANGKATLADADGLQDARALELPHHLQAADGRREGGGANIILTKLRRGVKAQSPTPPPPTHPPTHETAHMPQSLCCSARYPNLYLCPLSPTSPACIFTLPCCDARQPTWDPTPKGKIPPL